MKVTDLKENEVIHCETLEQYDAICKLLHEAGYKWFTDEPYCPVEEKDWRVYKKDTVIDVTYGELVSISHLSEDYKIHPATDFITPTQTKEEYAKERAIGFAEWWVESEIVCYKNSYYYDNNGNEYRSINELYDEYLKSLLQTQD